MHEHRSRLGPLVAAVVAAALVWPGSALAHGDPVPVSELSSSWELSPLVLAYAALAVVLFAQAFVRLRRRGRPDLAGWGRAALFAAALAVALLALLSPLDAVGGQYLLSGHMLQHVLVADVAVALFVVSVRGPLLAFLVPVALLRPLARSRSLRSVQATLLRPRVAFVLWALVLLLWHVPAAYEAALGSALVHDLQHASFVVGGLLAWVTLVDPARRRRLSPSRRVAFAVGMFAVGQVLASALIFSFRPFYGLYAAQDERLFGISPLLDQQLAGVVMMFEQVVALGLFVAFVALSERRNATGAGRPGSGRRSTPPLPARQ